MGPIPVSDGIGREVISDIQTDLRTGGLRPELFTDSNGREFLQRVWNSRPSWDLEVFEPVAGNYYPISAAAYLAEGTDGQGLPLQLSVLSDRAEGAASLRDGQLELMLHRRLLADDDKGVDEALNETVGGMSHYPTWTRSGDGIVARGRHWLLLSDRRTAMRELRTAMDQLFLPLLSFYSEARSGYRSGHGSGYRSGHGPEGKGVGSGWISPLSSDLPENVHLVTLETLSDSQLLVRLGHQFAAQEDENGLSDDVQLDLRALFARFSPLSCDEYTLSANQLYSDRQKHKVHWKSRSDSDIGQADRAPQRGQGKGSNKGKGKDSDGCSITLSAMQIKTFIINF